MNYEIKEDGKGKDYEVCQQRYAQLIQKYVRGWINRSKYTGVKRASNKLKQSNLKTFLRYEKIYQKEKAKKP